VKLCTGWCNRGQNRNPPLAAVLWQAANPNARDFRLETIGPAYRGSSLEANPDGTYTAMVPEPTRGWVAYFLELTFPSRGPFPFKFTTEARVAPSGSPSVHPPNWCRPGEKRAFRHAVGVNIFAARDRLNYQFPRKTLRI
jgi:PhoPQ-activated pathogenicity-related protein